MPITAVRWTAIALAVLAVSTVIPAGKVTAANDAFTVTEVADFDEPWAMAFLPDGRMLVTEKKGLLRIVTQTGQKSPPVGGVPDVDYGGQGGLGDVAFLPGEASKTLGGRTIYLSWAEAGETDTRGAAVGRGKLVCATATACCASCARIRTGRTRSGR